jgi:hypothetical protein
LASYSFLDAAAAITGPGGAFSIGPGAGNAEEGITVTMTENKNTMTIGADGSVMHSLHAGKSGTITVRLLKTSPTNKRLSDMYAVQTVSAALHGKNTIVVNDLARGDVITCSQVAFEKFSDITFAKEGGMNTWTFQAGVIDFDLASGDAIAA